MSTKERHLDQQANESFSQEGLAIMRQFPEKYPNSFHNEEIDKNGIPFVRATFDYRNSSIIVSPIGIVIFVGQTPENIKYSNYDFTPVISSQLEKIDKNNTQPEIVLKRIDGKIPNGTVKILSRTKFKDNSHLKGDLATLKKFCHCHEENIKFRKERFNLPPIVYPKH